MAVTAKFKVSRNSPMGDPDAPWAHEVELTPDYSGDRNKDWSAATPSGMCRLTITNPSAYGQFKEGQAFTLTFEENNE